MKKFCFILLLITTMCLGSMMSAIAENDVDEITSIKKRIKELEEKLSFCGASKGKIASFKDKHQFKTGLRAQVYYQAIEDAAGDNDKYINDFVVRRLYFYMKGKATDKIGYFGHVAADKVGQDGLDNPSMGLGSGLAVRDLWLSYEFDKEYKIQVGRMYIPFTRAYGTTTTFANLTLDLPISQGGFRCAPFYSNKVGRDDGIVVWGNVFDDHVQYRVGITEGIESSINNPDDNLRYVGRVTFYAKGTEKGWYNKGTYLGKKKIVAFGAGYDYQQDLVLDNMTDQNNEAWTVDAFFDYPVGDGAVTVEASYANLKNSTQTLKVSNLKQGADAQIYYIQAGYLCPFEIGTGKKIQPYFRYEFIEPDDAPDTSIPSVGINYYLDGNSAKLTLDWTQIHQEEAFAGPLGWISGDRNQNIITCQFTVGF